MIGSNLLNIAHRVIPSADITLLPFLRRDKQPNGNYVNVYDDAVIIIGNAQPVPRERYGMLGLDFNKNYLMVYSSSAISDVGVGKSADRIGYENKRFCAIGNNDWKPVDGWNGVMFVEDAP